MSIDSIGSSILPQAIKPASEVLSPQQETRNLAPATEKQTEVGHGEYPSIGHYGMSTQDFLQLKSQSRDEPFAILDKVIASMKENMEEVGEALESLKKLVEQSSQSNLALKLLEETFEAVDKMQQR